MHSSSRMGQDAQRLGTGHKCEVSIKPVIQAGLDPRTLGPWEPQTLPPAICPEGKQMDLQEPCLLKECLWLGFQPASDQLSSPGLSLCL